MKKLEMRKNETDGLLITFCGLDGSGKTTIMNKLLSDISVDHSVLITKQPTDMVRQTEIFRTYMDTPDHDAYDYRSLSLLAASDRIQHVNKVIQPALNQGKIVFSDRYFYSCLANLRARGYKEDEWIYDIAKFVIQPDIAFFFDIPADKALARVRSREEEKDRYIDVFLQEQLRNEYLDISNVNGGILVSTETTLNDSYLTAKKAMERIFKK